MLSTWLLMACIDRGAPSDDSASSDSAPATDDTDATDSHTGGDTETDTGPPPEPPKNLFVLSIDTLRRNELGVFGGAGDTPTLDALLASGHHYRDMRSCSNWTYPAMACAVLGVDIVDIGFLPGTSDPTTTSLPEDATTVPERLEEAGFRTALVSGNSIVGRSLGFGRGHVEVEVEESGSGEDLVDMALEVLDGWQAEESEAPWALHLHLMDPHLPYEPPESYMVGLEALDEMPWDLTSRPGIEGLVDARESGTVSDETWLLANELILGGYHAELAYLDDQIARLLEELEARDAVDDTLFVLFSDHGESFGENKVWLHHMSLYDAETEAIGALVHPRSIPAAEDDTLQSIQLLGPAALDILGVESQAAEEGPRFADAAMPEGFLTSVEQDGLRLIYKSWTGELDLYDRDADPEEAWNLYAPGDARVRELWEVLEPRIDKLEVIEPGALFVDPTL